MLITSNTHPREWYPGVFEQRERSEAMALLDTVKKSGGLFQAEVIIPNLLARITRGYKTLVIVTLPCPSIYIYIYYMEKKHSLR